MTFGSVYAAEYFVSPDGEDTATGLSRETAFASIQKGIDSLSTGDTLTITPGEYLGGALRKGLGGEGQQTTIRAEIPGTAVIRGDVSAPKFSPDPEMRGVFAADFKDDLKREVQSVNEWDTQKNLKEAATKEDVAFSPGSWFYDASNKKLYILPSDLQPANKHYYTVSVVGTHGLTLEEAVNLHVEGLAFTGFNSREPLRDYRPQYVVWGLYLPFAKKCVIKNVTAWANGGGVLITSSEKGGGNLIEDSIGYGNGSPHNSEGGNISIFGPHNDTIRNCIGYRGQGTGVRLYGTSKGEENVIDKSLGWGNKGPDVGIKGGGLEKTGWNKNSIGLRMMPGHHFSHCIIGDGAVYQKPEEVAKDNLFLKAEKINPLREFVDAINFDYRLQSTSKLRNAAPDGSDRGPFPYQANVYFVRSVGDDKEDGLSMKGAWRTLAHALKHLKPGDTVYFDEGDYEGDVEISMGNAGEEPVSFRARGMAQVRFTGNVKIKNSQNLDFQRLAFSKSVAVEGSRQIAFQNIIFAGESTGLVVKATQELRVTHSEFVRATESGLVLEEAKDVFLSSNIFANKQGAGVTVKGSDEVPAHFYSDYNAYADTNHAWMLDGTARSLESLAPRPESHSLKIQPDYREGENGWELVNRVDFLGRGALGWALGWHQDVEEQTLTMSEPVVHSVTATTANIEWAVTRGASCVVAWGETPACENEELFEIFTYGDLFRTMSLTGLKPDTKYYFRVKEIRMLAYPDFGPVEVVDPHYETISFTTLAADRKPVAWYVSNDGDNARSGESREQAWKTIAYAASKASPGDTVLVAGGTYKERVRVRTTGEKGLPITFRNIPGEKVILDGDRRRLDNAFTINGKKHIIIDGFYFYNHHGEPGGNVSTRLFDVISSEDVLIRRCLMNGLGGGAYPASFLTGWNTKNLVLSNIVSILAPDGVEVTRCPDFRIEHSVFVLTMISNVKLSTPATLYKNIFCDSGAFKSLQKIQLQMYYGGDVTDSENCYFFRLPDKERVAFVLKWPEKISLEQFKQRDPRVTSFIANPEFAVLAGIKDRKLPDFPIDELSKIGSKLDFNDLFTTNPELIKNEIGLQPELFKEFHFSSDSQP